MAKYILHPTSEVKLNLRNSLKIATFADKILFISLIILSLSGILFINKLFNHANYVKIEVDGKLEYIFPINENRVISVKGVSGNTTLEIKDNRVRITESPCSIKVCLKQGWISKGALICIPNKVIVIIENQKENKNNIDAVSG